MRLVWFVRTSKKRLWGINDKVQVQSFNSDWSFHFSFTLHLYSLWSFLAFLSVFAVWQKQISGKTGRYGEREKKTFIHLRPVSAVEASGRLRDSLPQNQKLEYVQYFLQTHWLGHWLVVPPLAVLQWPVSRLQAPKTKEGEPAAFLLRQGASSPPTINLPSSLVGVRWFSSLLVNNSWLWNSHVWAPFSSFISIQIENPPPIHWYSSRSYIWMELNMKLSSFNPVEISIIVTHWGVCLILFFCPTVRQTWQPKLHSESKKRLNKQFARHKQQLQCTIRV